MGVLVDVDSETFLLPKEHFMAAKRALEALAVDYPTSFEVPKSVAGCEDLQEALAAAFWRFETNTKGDLVMLSYGADKAPESGSWPVPVLEALAPFVTRGTIVHRIEGDDRETVYTLANGKLLERRRKRTTRKVATAPERAQAGAWIVAPEDSFGIEWRVRLPGENEWYRKRDRVASFVEALAKTKVWRELEEVYFRAALLPITKKGGALPVADVVKRVADAQWGVRWLASRDRETTLELDISTFELGFRLRVRDGALARVGSAVIDEVAPILASHAREHRSREPVVGHAAPFGRGYMRPVDAAGAVLLGPMVHPAGELHFRAHALATIFDGRRREKGDDDDDDDTAKTIRQLAAAKKVPRGAKRTEDDGVVVVTFPCDVTDREAVRAAAAAHATWIRASAAVAAVPSSFPKPKPIAKKARRADDPALEEYELAASFELILDDDPYWFRDRAFFEVVYRAFAKTAYWPELAKPGAAALEKAIAAVKTGRNDKRSVLARADAVKLDLSPNVNELVISVSATRRVLAKLGARATRDLVAFLGEAHGALAGRGQLDKAYIGAWSDEWTEFVGVEHADVRRWPIQNATVDIFDPLAAEDGRNGRGLHVARTLAAAPVPPGAERIEAGRLVAVLFTDDLSDPIATAEATARRAAWIRSVQAATGL